MSEAITSSFRPRVDLRDSPLSTPITFAVVLALGLFVVTPLVAVVLRTGPFSGFVPPLVGLALALCGYGLFVVVTGEWFVGALVCLLVTVTLAANVPLAADASAYPRAAGPVVWVFQAPLAIAVVLGARRLPRARPSLSEGLLFGFTGWAALGALFAAGPRPDVMLYFAFFFVEVSVVLVLVSRSVQEGILTLRDVIGTFCIAAGGHVAVALFQFVFQAPLGFSVLGEGSKRIGTVSVGEITMETGGFVSGFAAGGINSLMILTLPTVALFALRWSGWRRGVAVVTIGAMLVVQRGTANDSARGALLLGGGLFLVGFFVLRSVERRDIEPTDVLSAVVGVIGSVAILLFPASGAGSSSDPTRGVATTTGPPTSEETTRTPTVEPATTSAAESTPTAAADPATSATSTRTTNSSSTGPGSTENAAAAERTTAPASSAPAAESGRTGEPTAASSAPDAGSIVENASVPLFDLRSLGVRIEQYAAGFDLFTEYPLFGIGAGNFMFYARDYGLLKSFRMHSLYVALLAETGIVGTALYLGAVLAGLGRGATLLSAPLADSARVVDRSLVLAVGCGLVGLLAAGMWGPFLDSLPRVLPFWALMGALVGYARAEDGRGPSRTPQYGKDETHEP